LKKLCNKEGFDDKFSSEGGHVAKEINSEQHRILWLFLPLLFIQARVHTTTVWIVKILNNFSVLFLLLCCCILLVTYCIIFCFQWSDWVISSDPNIWTGLLLVISPYNCNYVIDQCKLKKSIQGIQMDISNIPIQLNIFWH
jgi:hypothetical protein